MIDLKTERAEFRGYLYEFWEKIQFPFTPKNSEKNRKEFDGFRHSISINDIGIYRSRYKTANFRISVVI